MKLKIAIFTAALLGGTSAIAGALLGATSGPPAGADENCVALDARVVVSLEKHALLLCDKGKTIDTFGVRLGRGGIGKTCVFRSHLGSHSGGTWAGIPE